MKSGKPQRFEYLWRNKWLTSEAKTIDDMINSLREAAYDLEKMKNVGIMLDDECGGTSNDYATLYTTDPKIAEEFGLQKPELDEEEEEFEDEASDDES